MVDTEPSRDPYSARKKISAPLYRDSAAGWDSVLFSSSLSGGQPDKAPAA